MTENLISGIRFKKTGLKARNVEQRFQPAPGFNGTQGLKARDLIAWAGAPCATPGSMCNNELPGL
jgi:hypothetical protein